MDDSLRCLFDSLHTRNVPWRYAAYLSLMDATQSAVDWAYEAWDDLVALLSEGDNHQRAMAAQLLANLAAFSDPDKRVLRDGVALLAVTRDRRFVTARHSLLALWKVGLAGDEQRRWVVQALAARFHESAGEKNGTLIRSDIIEDLALLYRAQPDESVRAAALALVAVESDAKYRAKYAAVWRRTLAAQDAPDTAHTRSEAR